MIKISEIVEEIVREDEYVMLLGPKKLINFSSFARIIQDQVEQKCKKEVKIGSIVAALTRFFNVVPQLEVPKSPTEIIDRLSVHSNLEGMTIERSEKTTQMIQKIYEGLTLNSNSFITITQGVNEITLVLESSLASIFRASLKNFKKIYDKKNLVGISIKFDFKYLEIPNILFQLHRRIVVKKINIIEMISTATELTFILEKKDLKLALESLQKNF